MFKEDFVQIPTQRSQIPSFHQDDLVKRPDAHQSTTSVRTRWQYRPDAHQCLETLNCSRLHSSGRNGKSSSRSSEFEKNTTFKCIRPDDVAISSGCHSVFDKIIGFLSQTQLWEDSCKRPDDVCSRPDAILDKASRAEEVQLSGHQTLWPGCLNHLIMEIACNRSAAIQTLG